MLQQAETHLVERLLALADLVLVRRPEPRAVRGENLINQDNLIRLLVETKFKLGICDDDSPLSSVRMCL